MATFVIVAVRERRQIYTPQTYTGATLINGGAVTLRDTGALVNTSAIDINYSTLSADNSTSFYNSTNRINDAAAITLRGGTLTIQGRPQTASSEVIGNVIINQGFNVINPLVGGIGVNSIDVTAGDLSRTAGSASTLIVQGTNTGTIGNNSRMFVSSINGVSTSTLGGGLTNNIVGGWAENGNDFLTYTPAMGFAALGQTGAAAYDSINSIPGGNIGATGRAKYPSHGFTFIPTGGATVNALSMSRSNIALNFVNSSDVLNITSGGLDGLNQQPEYWQYS